jgi:hypothetical protein
MSIDAEKAYDAVYQWSEEQGFAGHDPFDGLESRAFQVTPLKHVGLARLAWLQMVKRSSTDLRSVLQVPKGMNAKGIALFASAELSRFRATGAENHRQNSEAHLRKLRESAIQGSTARGEATKAFGYNFDWQSRAFYAPKGTPTIVPTAFAARAFIENYQLSRDDADRDFLIEICRFIVNDLNRPHDDSDTVCFSYTPRDRSLIFNASLLAGETLASVGAITGNAQYTELALKSARYVLENQDKNGSWAYGPKLRHKWVDNFHTAFILLSLKRIGAAVPELNPVEAIQRGFDFWIENLFLPDGTPKYYDSATYPVDIHSAAAAIAVLAELRDEDTRAVPLAEKVAAWTIENMRDRDGFFYYQLRESGTVKTPFIRWGQAWMAYALAKLLEARAAQPISVSPR